ncbi:MAG: hypothetical protein GY938_17065 [Ketobacter sp.]|nr:hypothetical protein [Ketobacter sp.]
MTDEKSISAAEKYESNRDHFRSEALKKFLSYHEKSNQFIAAMNEVVASHMLYASNKDWSHIEHGEYISKLIVSFTRSHFVITDHVMYGELIEAAVLLRKQFELMSRLVEIDSGVDIDRLLKKTPNVKHLESDLKKLYSEYSEITHSSDIQKLDLLGYLVKDKATYTAVYPVFQENSFVSALHLFLLFSQYHYWIVDKLEQWFPEYDRAGDCAMYAKCHEAYEEIYYKSPVFTSIGSASTS